MFITHILLHTFIRENYAEIMIGKHDFEVGNRDFKSQFGAIFMCKDVYNKVCKTHDFYFIIKPQTLLLFLP